MTATILISLSALLELLPHLIVYAAAVEVFSSAPAAGGLWRLALIALGGTVLRFLLLGSGYILSHRAAFAMVRELRLALISKLGRVPTSYFSQHPSGDIKKTIVDDVANLEGVFAHNLPELASGLFVPLAAAAVLLWTDWRMGLAGLALLPVAFAVQARVMSGYKEGWAKWHAAEALANEGVLEFIRGVAVLKAFDRDASSLAQVRDGVVGIRDLATEMTRRTMVGYALFFSLLSGNLLVVLPVGLALFLSGAVERDGVILFVALGAGMLQPLVKLLFLFGSAQKTSAALTRIEGLLSAEELPEPSAVGTPPPIPEIRFKNVSFTYRGRKRPAVECVSFTLAPNTITAVVGTSGAGKTTLVSLLTRAYDIDEGSITVGGRDLRSLSSEQRVRLLGHVSQDTTLFDGTVRDNLLLANPDASQSKLLEACTAAHAHGFIEALPKGYDTPLGDRGGHLSGGERQRIAIARALLKGAPIIVLDEVTAAVDPESERGIQEGLSALAIDRSVLVVAHRLRTVVEANRIIVMDHGHLVDMGTHKELLDRCGVYRSLWRDQEQAQRWTLIGGAA